MQDLEIPDPGPRELLIRVSACGVCRTDLHIVEGDLDLPKLPLTPGHQIVGRVEKTGTGVSRFHAGDRVGISWISWTCGDCAYCRSDRENLCDTGKYTGYHVDGGYAEYALAHEAYAFPLPAAFSDIDAAPLLCAGVIGHRALRLSGIAPGQTLGLFGFGASAHIVIQLAQRRGCTVAVFTRSQGHRDLAEELGASWAGPPDQASPPSIDAGIIFAPAGELVPLAMRLLNKGGTLALAGIHMSRIPAMEYSLLYEERTLRSVANSTRRDVIELLNEAAAIPVRTQVHPFLLQDANEALVRLKQSDIRGSGVIVVDGSR